MAEKVFNTEFEELRNRENKIYRDTKKEFSELIIHIEKGFDIFQQIVDKIAEKEAVGKSFRKYAVFILSFRIVRITRSAYWCITHGYYETGQALLRLLFENHLLLLYLHDKENESKEWLNGKQFRPLFLRQHVSVSYDKVYSELSGFVHPKIETCRDWFFTDRDKEATFWVTKYDRKWASLSLANLETFFSATILLIPIAFLDFFAKIREEEDKIAKTIGSWNKEGEEIRKKVIEKT